MKRIFRLAALGVALLPTAAFADTTPAAAPPGRPDLTDAQRGQMESAMRAGMQQMERLHVQERTSIIGSLSAAHRAALANIIGNLALTPNPDRETAARQIDAMLSQSEARSVLTTHMQARSQEKTLRDAQRQAFLSVLTPDQRTAMDARRAEFEASHASQAGPNANRDGRMGDARMGERGAASGRTPDAGHVLLMLSEGGHEGMGHGHFMGGPGGPGGPGPA